MKHKLFAMKRQLKAPDIFFTKSACEVNYHELFQTLTEKERNRLLAKEEMSSGCSLSFRC